VLGAGDASVGLETSSKNAAAVNARDLRVDPESLMHDHCLYPRRQAPAVNAGYGLAPSSGLEMTPFFAHFTTFETTSYPNPSSVFRQHLAERAIPTQVDISGLADINMVLDDFHKFCRVDLQIKSWTAYLNRKSSKEVELHRMIGELDGENGGGYKESDRIKLT